MMHLQNMIDEFTTRADDSDLIALLATSRKAHLAPAVNQICDKVLAAPGVAAVAKPAIDDLRAKLDALAKI